MLGLWLALTEHITMLQEQMVDMFYATSVIDYK